MTFDLAATFVFLILLVGSSTSTIEKDSLEGPNAACDCNYHPGGCTISKIAPANYACKCQYKGAWTCNGYVVECREPNDDKCRQPDNSFRSCMQGDGDCQGYKEGNCDCDYHPGGCKISSPPPAYAACRCNYKGAWTCGGHLVRCPVWNNHFCLNPDFSKATCQFGGGDCGGY
ncbi:uncharacterized protein [Clytia hemisphaerica]|uniref:Uncharacterized protein n=1 Tax=Clytia hemisphaerica TaxID=252671 RepID=A0A7M5V799_9CNID|eukprot:TCONS_00046802-protein